MQFCLFFFFSVTFTFRLAFYSVIVGAQNSVNIFVWEAGQSSFRYFQSLDFSAVNKIHSFTPASGRGKAFQLLTDLKRSVGAWHGFSLIELGHYHSRYFNMDVKLKSV